MCTQILNEHRYQAENALQCQENYKKSTKKTANNFSLFVQKLWSVKLPIKFFEFWLKKDFV